MDCFFGSSFFLYLLNIFYILLNFVVHLLLVVFLLRYYINILILPEGYSLGKWLMFLDSKKITFQVFGLIRLFCIFYEGILNGHLLSNNPWILSRNDMHHYTLHFLLIVFHIFYKNIVYNYYTLIDWLFFQQILIYFASSFPFILFFKNLI